MIIDSNFSQTYSEKDATEWLWPRQDFTLENWTANIIFNLESAYSLHVGSNLNSTIEFVPFLSWINAKFVLRAWDYDNSTKINWTQIDWIKFNFNAGSALIDLSKVNFTGSFNVGFQAQSYTTKFVTSYEDVITQLYNTSITLINQNSEIVTPNFDKYVVNATTKNFTISLTDEEDDKVYIKTNSSSGLYVFSSKTNRDNTFNIVWEAPNNLISIENLTVYYYDSYHLDSNKWKNITFQINVFLSEPPRFSKELENIVVNMWTSLNFSLPDISDPDNDLFSVFILGNDSNWIQVTSSNSKYFLIFDSSLLGQLTQNTTYNVEIKLEDSTKAFMIYSFNVTVIQYASPYFSSINDLVVSDLTNEYYDFEINSMFSLPYLGLVIKTVEWISDNIMPWVIEEIKDNSNSFLIRFSHEDSGIYWAKFFASFVCKDFIR